MIECVVCGATDGLKRLLSDSQDLVCTDLECRRAWYVKRMKRSGGGNFVTKAGTGGTVPAREETDEEFMQRQHRRQILERVEREQVARSFDPLGRRRKPRL